MSGRSAVRAVAVVTMVVSVIGAVAAFVFGAFVLDDYDAYGEAPIPGSAKLHLPAGRVAVNFRTLIVGNPSGAGLPIPHLILDIDPPASIGRPTVTENLGNSISYNGDIHRRVWMVEIPNDGDYIVTTSGEVNGYVRPRLAFGRQGSTAVWLGISAALFVIGLTTTVVTSVPQRRPKPAEEASLSDAGVKIEQLKTLAALRDSGALSEKEFQAEKRRVLKGD